MRGIAVRLLTFLIHLTLILLYASYLLPGVRFGYIRAAEETEVVVFTRSVALAAELYEWLPLAPFLFLCLPIACAWAALYVFRGLERLVMSLCAEAITLLFGIAVLLVIPFGSREVQKASIGYYVHGAAVFALALELLIYGLLAVEEPEAEGWPPLASRCD